MGGGVPLTGDNEPPLGDKVDPAIVGDTDPPAVGDEDCEVVWVIVGDAVFKGDLVGAVDGAPVGVWSMMVGVVVAEAFEKRDPPLLLRAAVNVPL